MQRNPRPSPPDRIARARQPLDILRQDRRVAAQAPACAKARSSASATTSTSSMARQSGGDHSQDAAVWTRLADHQPLAPRFLEHAGRGAGVGLARAAALDQLDRQHQSAPADVADHRPPLRALISAWSPPGPTRPRGTVRASRQSWRRLGSVSAWRDATLSGVPASEGAGLLAGDKVLIAADRMPAAQSAWRLQRVGETPCQRSKA